MNIIQSFSFMSSANIWFLFFHFRGPPANYKVTGVCQEQWRHVTTQYTTPYVRLQPAD